MWDGLFSGAILVSGRIDPLFLTSWFKPWPNFIPDRWQLPTPLPFKSQRFWGFCSLCSWIPGLCPEERTCFFHKVGDYAWRKSLLLVFVFRHAFFSNHLLWKKKQQNQCIVDRRNPQQTFLFDLKVLLQTHTCLFLSFPNQFGQQPSLVRKVLYKKEWSIPYFEYFLWNDWSTYPPT